VEYRVVKTASALAAVLLVVSGCQTIGQRLEARRQTPPATPAVMSEQSAVVAEQPPATPHTYKLFFSNTQRDPTLTNCGATYWVSAADSQAVSNDDDVIRRAVELLLSGVPARWHDSGYTTSLPVEATLNSVRLDGDVAYIDFAALPAAGSCRVIAIRSQIENTVVYAARELLNRNIAQVVISVNGDAQTALQP